MYHHHHYHHHHHHQFHVNRQSPLCNGNESSFKLGSTVFESKEFDLLRTNYPSAVSRIY